MKLTINIEKKHFFGLLVLGLIVLGVVGVFAYNAGGSGGNPSIFGHSVDEIDWSRAISKNVTTTESVTATGFCIGTDCRTAWWPTSSAPSGVTKLIAGSGISVSSTGGDGTGNVTISATSTGSGSQWTTTSGGSIFYNSGNVGIRVSNPTATLEVSGGVKADTFCIGSDCRSGGWPRGTLTSCALQCTTTSCGGYNACPSGYAQTGVIPNCDAWSPSYTAAICCKAACS